MRNLKTSRKGSKIRRGVLTRRTPPNLPDDVLHDGIEWDDDPDVVSLAHRFGQWLTAEKLIDADWRRDALKQIAAVTDEIETGLLLNKLEDERTFK